MTLTLERQFGDGALLTGASSFTLPVMGTRQYTIDTTSGDVDLILPDARKLLVPGGMLYRLHNLGTNDAVVKDPKGATVETIGPNESGAVYCTDISSEGGAWFVIVGDVLGTDPDNPDPPVQPGGTNYEGEIIPQHPV